MKRTARFNDHKKPLVSILLQSYNDGKYLGECLDSILNQTYDNIEICLYDCASTDDSWSIGMEYQRNNPGIITLIDLRKNYYPDRQLTALHNVRGKYFMSFDACCSIDSELIKKCVEALEDNLDAAYANINNVFIDKSGASSVNSPLYAETGIVQGHEHILKLLCLNPPVNVAFSMYKTEVFKINGIVEPYCAELILSSNHTVYYIREPLFTYREAEHISFPGVKAEMGEIYMRFNQKYAIIRSLYTILDMEKVLEIVPDVLNSLGHLSLKYSIKALNENDIEGAKKFYYLAAAIDLNIENDDTFKRLQEYWIADGNVKQKITESSKHT